MTPYAVVLFTVNTFRHSLTVILCSSIDILLTPKSEHIISNTIEIMLHHNRIMTDSLINISKASCQFLQTSQRGMQRFDSELKVTWCLWYFSVFTEMIDSVFRSFWVANKSISQREFRSDSKPLVINELPYVLGCKWTNEEIKLCVCKTES